MILCDVNKAGRYRSISPAMALAIDWLQAHLSEPFESGIVTIGHTGSGSEIYVKFEETTLLPREKAQLEAHRRYIDIQLPVKGVEKMGWSNIDELRHSRGLYDADADIQFFGDAASTLFIVRPGQMAVFFPEDAHAPNIGLGNHRKIIIKVPVE